MIRCKVRPSCQSRRIRVALATVALAFGLAFAAPSTALASIDEAPNLVDPTQRADNSFIYDTTVAALYSQASLYDDRTVQVTGEVIGDRVNAAGSQGYWITLTETQKENKSSISLLMSEEQTEQISHYGRYGVVGTTLQVRGTYHQSCVEHDGLPDVHVTNASVLEQGRDINEKLDPPKLLPGILAILVGIGLLGLFNYLRERER